MISKVSVNILGHMLWIKLFAQTSNRMFVSNPTSLRNFHGESEVDDLINTDLDSVSKWESC